MNSVELMEHITRPREANIRQTLFSSQDEADGSAEQMPNQLRLLYKFSFLRTPLLKQPQTCRCSAGLVALVSEKGEQMQSFVPNPILENAVIQANVSKGFQLTTPEGKPAKLAVIDEEGNVLVAGADVAWAAWRVCIVVQENFWAGQGHFMVHTSPPGIPEVLKAMGLDKPGTAV